MSAVIQQVKETASILGRKNMKPDQPSEKHQWEFEN